MTTENTPQDEREKLLKRIFSRKPMAYVAVAAAAIVATSSLISSVQDLRKFIIGEHVLLREHSGLRISELTPEAILKNEALAVKGRSVAWLAKVEERQSEVDPHIVKVVSGDLSIKLHLRDLSVVRLCRMLKPGSEIFFEGTIEGPNGFFLDIQGSRIYFTY